ncbi:hypothetical protein [Streptomyces sp. NPDC056891]|uniref:hypothetical protein n=1 Tax=unclassified Streptomyces TaxID=2593676 RepID=UPI0036AA9C76
MEDAVLYGLLTLGAALAAALAALAIDEIRRDARSRIPRCMTCGGLHHRHAAHR